MTAHYIGAGPQYAAFTKQNIVGDNVSVLFTLAQNAPSVSSLLVLKNGLTLQPTVDYSLAGSGAQISFLVAPLATDKVWIIFTGENAIQVPQTVCETNTFACTGTTGPYAMTSEPYASSNVLVFIDGLLQKNITNYTISGSTITTSVGPATGSTLDVVHMKIAPVTEWVAIANTVTAFNMLAGGKYLVNVSSGGATGTMPASPTVGDEIAAINTSTAPNALTVKGNGNNVQGNSTYAMSATGASATFVYSSSGWWKR